MNPARPLIYGRRVLWLLWLLSTASSVAYFVGFRQGSLPRDPWNFAILVGVTCIITALLAAVEFLLLVRGRQRPLAGTGRILLLAGLLAAGMGGWLNWAYSLQGYMVLTEGEEVPLFHGTHLQAFDAGPLSNPLEMGLTVKLVEVELVGAADGSFSPELNLIVTGTDGVPQLMTLTGHGTAAIDTLRLHGGAFGFAPHLVLEEDGVPFFDKVVPFTSRREGDSGIAFEGIFTVASRDLEIRGTVFLDSLDAALRGHPALGMTVRQGRQVIGSGSLQPGHLALLENGMTIGFAGLEMWAEIDISRRNYPGPILWGGGVALLGVLVTLVGSVLRR